MAHKKTTSRKVASKAGKQLASKGSTRQMKSVAGSALGQKKGKRH